MDSISIHFVGTAGSVPTVRRGLPATVVRLDGDVLLFDCGEGTQRQLMRSLGLLDIDAVFITHFHADHWLGLPGMLNTYALNGREKPLEVFGPPGLRGMLKAMLPALGKLTFALETVEVEAHQDVAFEGYAVSAFGVRHRGPAYGYAVVEDERPGRFDAERARALGVQFGPEFGRLQRGETVAGVGPEQVIGAPRPGRRVVLSGDTAPCDSMRAAADGADVLVHEATFTEAERDRAAKTLHSTARQAAELADEAGVRLLALTHGSTRYTGAELEEEARAAFAAAVVPRDFDSIEVPFPERGAPTLVRWERPPRAPTG